ncbi:hypothetical protein AB3S75_027195 [Citrus x aurantiifolia]
MLELHRQVMDQEEKVALAESKCSQLESELADLKSDLEAAQSERDTQKMAYEEQIKSLDTQIAELKGKFADVDDRLDAEYDSGLALCYKCIMFVLKTEYPELNMNKLEASIQEYMVEQGQGDKNQEEVPLSGEQEKDTEDQNLDIGQGLGPAPSKFVGPSLPEIADPLSVEAIEPPTHDL